MFLEYDESLFVDRDKEIDSIREMVCSLNHGLPLKERTIFIFGPMGIGKTWLLRRLCTVLEEEAFTFYIDLSKELAVKAENIISQIVDQLEEWKITPTKGEKASLDELSRWLVYDVDRLLKANPGKSLVLCLDSIDKIRWEILGLVEDYIMVPLLRLPRVLLLVGGRRYIYPWRAPEIRVYHRTMLLNKFNPEASKEQVEKIGARVRSLKEIGRIHWLKEAVGYPWLNYLAATEENVEQIPEKVINVAFKDLPEDLLPVIEQLSVLRYFDETRMQLLVNGYANKPFTERKELVRKLQDLGLARWDEEKGLGYVLDSGLRIILETKLRRDKPEKWRELHQKACKFYDDWAKDPKYGKIWEEEAKYHREKLEEGAKC